MKCLKRNDKKLKLESCFFVFVCDIFISVGKNLFIRSKKSAMEDSTYYNLCNINFFF